MAVGLQGAREGAARDEGAAEDGEGLDSTVGAEAEARDREAVPGEDVSDLGARCGEEVPADEELAAQRGEREDLLERDVSS